MKTELVFFGTINESIEGLKKGFIAFVTLLTLDLIWFQMMDYSSIITKKPINKISALFVWILLCSAIGVQHNPQNIKISATYGALIGFVVYGVYNGTNYAINLNYPLSIAIIDTLWGIFVCCMASMSVYYFYHSSRFGLKKV